MIQEALVVFAPCKRCGAAVTRGPKSAVGGGCRWQIPGGSQVIRAKAPSSPTEGRGGRRQLFGRPGARRVHVAASGDQVQLVALVTGR